MTEEDEWKSEEGSVYKEQLYVFRRRSFPNDATEAAFLLGGIGTGNVSVGARGEAAIGRSLTVGQGNYLPYTFCYSYR